MSTIKTNNIQHVDATSANIALDSSGNATVNGTLTATSFSGDGSALTGLASDAISEGNTSAEVVDTGSNGHFKVTTEGTEALRVDASRRLLVGTSTSVGVVGAGSYTPNVQIARNANANLGLYGYYADAAGDGATLIFTRSRSNTVGTNTIVQSGDELGAIWFAGANNTGYDRAALIKAEVDGTPGSSGDMPGRLVFSTTPDATSSPQERMRIDNQGRLYHGQSSSFNPDVWTQTSGAGVFYHESGSGTTGFTINAATGYSVIYVNKFGYTGSTDNRLIDWYVNGSSKANITTNGSSVSYNTTSDYRLKTNVVQLTDAINRVKAFNPVRFNWVDSVTPGTFDGFLAHEAAQVVPESVNGEKDAVNDDGTPRYQNIDHSKLVPLLTAALQEAITRIESLESEVAALKATINP